MFAKELECLRCTIRTSGEFLYGSVCKKVNKGGVPNRVIWMYLYESLSLSRGPFDVRRWKCNRYVIILSTHTFQRFIICIVKKVNNASSSCYFRYIYTMPHLRIGLWIYFLLGLKKYRRKNCNRAGVSWWMDEDLNLVDKKTSISSSRICREVIPW